MERRVAARVLLDTNAFVCIGLVDFGQQPLIGYRWRRGRAPLPPRGGEPLLRVAESGPEYLVNTLKKGGELITDRHRGCQSRRELRAV